MKLSKFGFSWSWKRAIGLSALKAKISRKIGVPLSRSGRQAKLGRMTESGILRVLRWIGSLVGFVKKEG